MRDEDKRLFTRYTKESLCEVLVDSETYNGKVVDYSHGVGVIIKKVPQLVKGALADIRILDWEIEFSAEVVWVEDIGYHLRVGFRLLDNLKGNLKHYRLVDILLGLSKGRKTGILEIITGSTVKKIYIENGIKIFAVSTNTNDRLGEYLLTQGEITPEEYNQASDLVEKTGQRLGQVLIDLGYLKPDDLALSVQHHMEEIIMSLFNIDNGKFEFKEGPLITDEPIKLEISTANLIYMGIKRIKSIPMVDKMCPPLDTVFNLSRDPIPLFQSLTLEYTDKKILSNVNGINSLKTIISLSHSRYFETLKAIISLLTIGLINIKGADETPVKLPLEVIFGEPVEAPEEEVAEIGVGTAEEISERQSSVETQGEIAETSKEEEPIIDIPGEAPVEEIAEEKHEEKVAEIGAGTAEETSERQSSVETQGEIEETSKEEEPIIAIPGEAPVEEIAEEKHEEEAVAVGGGTAEETSVVPEPVAMHTDMAAAPGEEVYVQVNDMTSEKMTAEVIIDAVQPTADNADALEKPRSVKKWVISISIITILIVAIVSLVYKNIKTPLSPPVVTTIMKTESLPSFRDKALEKATTEIPEDKISFPTFREDALKKLLNK